MKTRSLPERLDDKSAQALLTNHFRERYNYNPAMADAIFRDAVFVRTLLDPTSSANSNASAMRPWLRADLLPRRTLRYCSVAIAAPSSGIFRR